MKSEEILKLAKECGLDTSSNAGCLPDSIKTVLIFVDLSPIHIDVAYFPLFLDQEVQLTRLCLLAEIEDTISWTEAHGYITSNEKKEKIAGVKRFLAGIEELQDKH